ncbi:MAG: hypothetical protein ACXWL2_01045 [Candidatus Chromulinivorax sp.]
MKSKLLIFTFYITSLFAYHRHDELYLPTIDINNPKWCCGTNVIQQKEESSCLQLVDKWNNEIKKYWQKLHNNILEEIGAYTYQIDYYMTEQRFIDVYMNMYYQQFEEYLDDNIAEENIDPLVMNFIMHKLYYLQLSKSVKIYPMNNIRIPAIGFGNDKEGYYLLINTDIFSKQAVLDVYNLEQEKKTNFCILPPTQMYSSQAVEYRNLLHLYLAEAVSRIEHQEDFFARMLQFFLYNKKQLSIETQKYGFDYVQFHGFIEATLQSHNPLEIAQLLQPHVDNLHYDFMNAWQELIKDIENCYNQDDLESYKAINLKERQAILFNTHQDDFYDDDNNDN